MDEKLPLYGGGFFYAYVFICINLLKGLKSPSAVEEVEQFSTLMCIT
jgi:hypothetical protein